MLFNDRAALCGFQLSVSSAESASKTDCGCRMKADHCHDNLQNFDEWPTAVAEQWHAAKSFGKELICMI
jgi:hypothetical protein